MNIDPYASGALNKKIHERLVADLENFAEDAGITPSWITEPLPKTTTQIERDYLRGFKGQFAKGISGLCLLSRNEQGQNEIHTAALAGCLVRNFIRARVMTLGTILDLLAKHEMPDLSSVLIPNFFISASDGGTIASWQINALYDFLISRHTRGLQTIICISDKNTLSKEYGNAFIRLIDTHYLQTKI